MNKLVLFLISFLFVISASAQNKSQELSSDEIYQKLQKLNFLGSVLYVAAHPDDENTQLISYFSNHTHAEVAYLAMTRGDGGQNLIGPEIREALGVIRTQELLAARKIDGGQQFFTRANDFGYSKTPQETFSIWDKQEVLSDVVRVFRIFHPDVIINRFNHRTEGDTHGHHTASARLSVEAFDLSGNPSQFSDQAHDLTVWQPEKLYFNTSPWFYNSEEEFEKADKSDFAKINVGRYLPMRGVSNTEIAAMSRSQHKSQGFGNTASRQNEMEFLEPIKGDFFNDSQSVFAGIDTSWGRVKGGKKIGRKLNEVISNYNFTDPSESLPGLVDVYQLIKNLPEGYWRDVKLEEAKELIAAASGLYLQGSTTEEFAVPGQDFALNIEATNRSGFPVQFESISYKHLTGPSIHTHKLNKNEPLYRNLQVHLPEDTPFTTPYWLKEKPEVGMYKVENEKFLGLPETPSLIEVQFNLKFGEVPISFERPVIYRKNNRVKGEVLKPFNVIPKISVNLKNDNLVFTDNHKKTIAVEVSSHKKNTDAELSLNHPENWVITPASIPVHFKNKGTKHFEFTVNPPQQPTEDFLRPVVKSEDENFSRRLQIIDYNHIPQQAVLLPTEAKLIRLDLKTNGQKIGYIRGAGDVIAENLKNLGYDVDVFSASEITANKLKKYTTVVLGIRLYNVSQEIVGKNSLLLDYVKDGGTLITQYNTTGGLKLKNPSPFELSISHDRVTDEGSPVTFLEPDHPVLNTPNKITKNDFEGWVQERGLYFPNQWGNEFKPIIALKDPGEQPKKGSLLIATYGKGYYVYTGLSFFREFPAGVSGAYRLFANLLALGNNV